MYWNVVKVSWLHFKDVHVTCDYWLIETYLVVFIEMLLYWYVCHCWTQNIHDNRYWVCVDCIWFLFKFDFLSCVVIRSFHPCHNGQWPPTSKDFYARSYPLQYVLILSLGKSQYFPFQCWVLTKGTTGTIFITSLVWRGP